MNYTINGVVVLSLLYSATQAMDNEVPLYHESLEPKTSWRTFLFDSPIENALTPSFATAIIEDFATARRLVGPIRFDDDMKKVHYYANTSPIDALTFDVTFVGEQVKVPFQPRNLAINKGRTFLLIEGVKYIAQLTIEELDDIGKFSSKSTTVATSTHMCALYSLKQKKLYKLQDYKRKQNSYAPAIGFCGDNAVAKYNLTYQEWKLPNL